MTTNGWSWPDRLELTSLAPCRIADTAGHQQNVTEIEIGIYWIAYVERNCLNINDYKHLIRVFEHQWLQTLDRRPGDGQGEWFRRPRRARIETYIYIYIYTHTHMHIMSSIIVTTPRLADLRPGDGPGEQPRYIYIYIYIYLYLSLSLSLSIYIYIYIYMYMSRSPKEGNLEEFGVETDGDQGRVRPITNEHHSRTEINKKDPGK